MVLLNLITTALATAVSHVCAQGTSPWLIHPPTPALPGNPDGIKKAVNGVQIWHTEFGIKNVSQLPFLILHGGFESSSYWGKVVEIVMNKHYVIVMDTRGQRRSSMDNTPFTYELFARDVLAALLNPKLSPMVGRGFATGASHNPEYAYTLDRLTRLYLASDHCRAINTTFASTAIYREFIPRAVVEYQAFQPNGNLTALTGALTTMGRAHPQWTQSGLGSITLGPELTLSWGEYEEAINLSEPALMHSWIKDSKPVIMPNVSHFAPLQDPEQFAAAVENFLS
ncbi:Alpha/Beta hydrolase protein [Rhizoctonia solani]|nr:Alpha/Beta hydrolase protein [Rhizoctonia solani]